MSEKEYLAKTKEDLVNLVRISGVMPITQARRMRKADLVAHLAALDAEGKEQSRTVESAKPAERAESKTKRPSSKDSKTRRSVFEVVLPEDSDTNTEQKSKEAEKEQVSSKETEDSSEASRTRRSGRFGTTGKRKTAHRSKMLPFPIEGEDESETEDDTTKVGYRDLENALKRRENEDSQAEPAKGKEDTTPDSSADEAVKTPAEERQAVSKPEVHVKDHRKQEPEVNREEARARPAGGQASRQMTSRGRGRKKQTDRDEKQRETKPREPKQRDRTETRDNRQKAQSERQASNKQAARPQAAEDDHQKEQNTGRSQQRQTQETISGVLEVMPDGYGFLRLENYIQNPSDAYVPPQLIRRFHLRNGDLVSGLVREQRDQDRYRAVTFINEVNGQSPEKMQGRPNFERLTPIYPLERFHLETVKNEFSTRIIDLFAPIGKGQRGMIVSPPKAGKTIFLQKIANSIAINHPNAKLLVLLIDERPEEVTDMQRMIKGEVVYSTFDKTPDNHVRITELVLDRAKRMVELGEDVVILLDSMTRMARAYNSTINPTGRTLSGGLDPGALYGPKKFFGAARNIENGGSLTVVATSLVETGSRMDEVIFEEFKGTGNMEVILDRKLSERRIFPAIDVNRSGTRREELLLTRKELDTVWGIRKAFGHMDTVNVTEMVLNLLKKTRDNEHFIQTVSQTMVDKGALDSLSPRR